jgi:Sec-independent protein secretion pathway component TatC
LFFQIPFLIFIFLNFGLLTEETLAKKRKLAYLLSLFLSIFLISDAFSQILIFLPFLFFYELAILVSLFLKNFRSGLACRNVSPKIGSRNSSGFS